MRRVCEEDYWYLDEDRPFKRSRRQGEKDENLVVTSYRIILKEKLLHVLQRVWQEIDAKYRDFVVEYNRKVNHNESTDEIDFPAKFRALFEDNYSTIIYPNPG